MNSSGGTASTPPPFCAISANTTSILVIGSSANDLNRSSDIRSVRLQGFDDGLRQRRVGIHQHEIVCGLRRQLVQQPEPFCCQFYVQGAETGGIAAGSAETGDESESEWVSDGKDDRNGLGCGFGRARRRRAQ